MDVFWLLLSWNVTAIMVLLDQAWRTRWRFSLFPYNLIVIQVHGIIYYDFCGVSAIIKSIPAKSSQATFRLKSTIWLRNLDNHIVNQFIKANFSTYYIIVVGLGYRRLKWLNDKWREMSDCIILIEEIT